MSTTGKSGIKGHRVRVDVGPAREISPEERLEIKLRGSMIGRTIQDVARRDDQLILWLDDGGTVAINAPGGLREID
jgi:hypothetical protein